MRRAFALLSLASLGVVAMVGCQRTSPVPMPAPSGTVAEAPKSGEPADAAKPAYDDISLPGQGRATPVIMYHDATADDKKTVWYDVTATEFRDQMAAIEREGMTPISLDQFYDHLTTGADLPEKPIVLTFDDNYQGFYDHAYPELKRRGWPVAMFVHTGFVGQTTGAHPKMSWDTLKTLVQDGLVTVGSHTISHPNDLSKLPPETQEKELRESKKAIEEKLGIECDYFAYPNGGWDAACADRVKAAGYKLSFTIENGIAEASPGIHAIQRYVHTKFENALKDRARALEGGAGKVVTVPLDRAAPVTYREGTFAGVKMGFVEGGDPLTLTSQTRESVSEFIDRTPGAVAGINGTFFALAAIRATDNRLVGPCKTTDDPQVLPDTESFRWPKLQMRPIIVMDDQSLSVVPYNPWTMNSDAAFRAFKPNVSDVFMGGAWLVSGGVPMTESGLRVFGSKDLMDQRRRAFFGVDGKGRIVLGASKQSCSSEGLAKAAAEAGVKEAVLLDSGFSTSLVYNQKILASGHSTKEKPSRPVPHAILLKGELDPAGVVVAEKAIPATTITGGDPSVGRKKKRRRR